MATSDLLSELGKDSFRVGGGWRRIWRGVGDDAGAAADGRGWMGVRTAARCPLPRSATGTWRARRPCCGARGHAPALSLRILPILPAASRVAAVGTGRP
jgi:hypothetical protein